MRARRRSLPFLALTAAAALAACGSSRPSAVTPAAYVKSVCGAVGPFERDVVNRSRALDLATFRDATEGKKALQAFLSALAGDAGGALAKLERAGTPDLQNGKAVSSAIVNAFSVLKAGMQSAATRARSLPTASAGALHDAVTKLSNSVKGSLSNIPSLSSSTLRSPELDQAAAHEPACRPLTNA